MAGGKYITDNPQFIVNGFVHAGICRVLDRRSSDDELDELLYEMDSSLGVSTTRDKHDDEVEPSEEFCSSHSTYDQQAKNPNRAYDRPVIVIYSSTSEEDA